MFGNKRKKATKAIIEHLKPIIVTYEFGRELPRLFWSHPYSLGFIVFSAVHFAKLATGGKIKDDELVYAVSDGLTQLSNLDGLQLYIDYCGYGSEIPNNEDFHEACDNAALILYYDMGIIEDESKWDHLVEAKEAAKNMPNFDERSTEKDRVLSFLMMKLFITEIENRLSDN